METDKALRITQREESYMIQHNVGISDPRWLAAVPVSCSLLTQTDNLHCCHH